MKKALPIIFVLFSLAAEAQSHYDSTAIAEHFKRADHILNILREFRIMAFATPEWQRADTAGIKSVQGGNFPAAANNRFIIRWGRFILGWEHEIVTKKGDTIKVGQFAFNMDATEKGFNGMYEFYGRIMDPWTGWFGIRGGIFLRPFGFETPDAANVHESPEGNRINQSLFPNISELGEEFIIESPRSFKPLYLRAEAGVVNGDGIGIAGETGAYQSRKDFMSRIWIGKAFPLSGGTKITINASGSYYNGGVMQTTNNVYEVEKNAQGTEVFQNITIGTADTAWKNHMFEYKRVYYGTHAQLNFDYGVRGEFTASTMFRGEFIAGQQPGQLGSSTVPTPIGTAVPGADLYIREFRGGAAYFTQSFHYKAGKQLMHTDLTFKFDVYNPNTQVKGSEILAVNHFSTTDLTYNTFSGGITFCPVQYFKLVLWYDHVVNENTGLADWSSDYKKDDVFTIRTQFSIDSWWFDKKTINPSLIQKSY
jgi:hypothetical protein